MKVDLSKRSFGVGFRWKFIEVYFGQRILEDEKKGSNSIENWLKFILVKEY